MNKEVVHTCKHDIHFKDGTFIPKGSKCFIKMKEGSHFIAEITAINNLNIERTYTVKAIGLYRHFKEFDSISEGDLNSMMMDGNNPSIYLLSECDNLEPDGSDEFGFPSKTLALI